MTLILTRRSANIRITLFTSSVHSVFCAIVLMADSMTELLALAVSTGAVLSIRLTPRLDPHATMRVCNGIGESTMVQLVRGSENRPCLLVLLCMA